MDKPSANVLINITLVQMHASLARLALIGCYSFSFFILIVFLSATATVGFNAAYVIATEVVGVAGFTVLLSERVTFAGGFGA